MAEVQMISPQVYVFGDGGSRHTVYGWRIADGKNIEPIVGNPDGPGVGRWSLYYGEDPWHIG